MRSRARVPRSAPSRAVSAKRPSLFNVAARRVLDGRLAWHRFRVDAEAHGGKREDDRVRSPQGAAEALQAPPRINHDSVASHGHPWANEKVRRKSSGPRLLAGSATVDRGTTNWSALVSRYFCNAANPCQALSVCKVGRRGYACHKAS